MFFKALKYDFLFGRDMFIGMAVFIVALSAIVRFAIAPFAEAGSRPVDVSYTVFVITLFLCGAMAVFQMLQVFYRNFFSDTGYLTLTLPVSRFPLLVSKVIVTFVWFNFMLAAVIIAERTRDNAFGYTLERSSSVIRYISNWRDFAEINLVVLFAILLIFFVIALAHSSLWRWRVNSIVAAAVGALYVGISLWAIIAIGRRSFVRAGPWNYRPIIGIRVGRIPISYGFNNYFDIFRFGLGVILCALLFCTTYYLLKKRVSL